MSLEGAISLLGVLSRDVPGRSGVGTTDLSSVVGAVLACLSS